MNTHSLKDFWYYFKQNKGALVGLAIIILFTIICLLAPLISPHNPNNIYPEFIKLPPLWNEGGNIRFLFGTDDVGRDLLSRLIYGGRISLGVGFLVVVFSVSVGVLLGLFAGFYGGLVDKVIMRFVDMLMSLPSILLAITIVSLLGPGLFNAILAVSLVSVPSFVRLTRAEVMSEKKKQYVMASESFGASSLRILFLGIFPNCLAPIIVQGTLSFSNGILDVAALGFLGLGAQPPQAEWGTMLADARSFIESSPWLVTLPGLCILIVVLSFNLFGDGLRDALDPRLKK